ncbi:hypothetical protein [Microseira sp. BLCC-F43]|jgi:hypothetical protein|uniref:hypothetical protein n=1 Tax=Microseira sp. BLCC-F43 TaxID=3153602 RepID=UPI0035BB0C9B
MALVTYGYVRATQDVDLLLSKEGPEAFRKALVGRGFVECISKGLPKKYFAFRKQMCELRLLQQVNFLVMASQNL